MWNGSERQTKFAKTKEKAEFNIFSQGNKLEIKQNAISSVDQRKISYSQASRIHQQPHLPQP